MGRGPGAKPDKVPHPGGRFPHPPRPPTAEDAIKIPVQLPLLLSRRMKRATGDLGMKDCDQGRLFAHTCYIDQANHSGYLLSIFIVEVRAAGAEGDDQVPPPPSFSDRGNVLLALLRRRERSTAAGGSEEDKTDS